jgi:hypothetical protein
MPSAFDYFWAPDEGVDVDDIRELIPFVVERAPNSDPNEVRRALASAVNCFLSETGVWRRESLPCAATEDEVRVSSGGCSRIISVESITRTADETVVFNANDQYRTPMFGTVRDDGSGMFVLDAPGAVAGDEYTADVVLTVRLGSELCPTWVMERWGEAIASKAAHELIAKGQPGITNHLNTYRAGVQGVIGRKAMGGSSRSSGPGSAISSNVERI